MTIHARGYPRAGLLGNPSDGFYGKTIAFCFTNFHAEVFLDESPTLVIEANVLDHSTFNGIGDLAENVRRYGYYGGLRLLKASIKRFYDYCQEQDLGLDDRNFTIRYHSTIPHRVGLAGSSAIITACFRAMMDFYDVEIPPHILAGLVLSVEVQELNIPAGLQDRVAQAYQTMMYMDFDRETMKRQGFGSYEPLELPPDTNLYIAYHPDLSEGTEVFHGDLRTRFNQGDPEVVNAMRFWAELTDRAREAIAHGRPDVLHDCINANFDKRCEIYAIGAGNMEMIETARGIGASAKFSGSGGAIVGTYQDDTMYAALSSQFKARGIEIFKPELFKEGYTS